MTVKNAMREALIESRRIVADALKAFGDCDHSVGICNCDMKRAIAASDAALADDGAARGTMREEFEAWADAWGYEITRESSGDYRHGGTRHAWEVWQASRDAAPQSVEPVAVPNSRAIVDLLREWQQDPEKAQAIEEARRYLAPPSTPTDAEWEAEHLRLVDSLRVADVHSALSVHMGHSTRADPAAALAALRAHLSTRPAQSEEWMPIETAPKDGTRVALSKEGGPVWSDCAWKKMARVPDRWESFVGPVRFEPTHWRPLPAPPTKTKEPGA